MELAHHRHQHQSAAAPLAREGEGGSGIWKRAGSARLPLQNLASCAGTEPDQPPPRPWQLCSPRLTVAEAGSVRSRFLDQHVPRLKQELEVHDGFHRSPLVPRCLKTLKYLFPCAVGTAQCRLSNELNRFGCAVQYNRRARADTQLWINWKVRHGEVTRGRGRSSTTGTNAFQSAP